MRIALISDIHLSRAKPYFHANWELLLEALAEDRPDHVLIGGDCALDGPHREEDLAFARAQFDRLPAPWHAVPGNHDVGNCLPDLRGETTVTEARREAWIRHFGPDWWALDLPGWRVIGLDCLIAGSGFPAEREQERFLQDALDGAGNRLVALLHHKPLCVFSTMETAMTQCTWYPEARAPVMHALREGRIRMLISGHLHESRDRLVEGVRHLWVPGTAFVQDIAGDWLPDRHGRRRVGYMLMELGAEPSVTLREPAPMLNTDIGNWLRGGIGHYATLSGDAAFKGLATADT
jgi:3',5'-cyclic AMP phosphodiesterase CpdA